ncbi:substrate-binding domain-containing protein [Coraliomargarita algicola]|uniref:Substrate-binding domain-containing protein n=1 Tax=Coraliomargarita algicola TaxID=3092156 RepID=A0ABZ0RJT8_9BACT|nr:substrate-binding domain-containing protein [Coraliomargarita sp. J2-16]WPJ95802.1 substrate-binding domain-containing protein [Coraliomargarita sp. J2-16]
MHPYPKKKHFRVVLSLNTQYSVARDFLAGFYHTIRPTKDWLVMQADSSPEGLEAAIKWQPDAMILTSESQTIERCAHTNINILYTMSLSNTGQLPWIGMDEYAVGATAAAHLRKAGYRNAACIYQSNHTGSVRRMQGFCQSMQAAGIKVILYTDSPQGGSRSRLYAAEDPALEKWLDNLPPSTGIYAWSDFIALWITEACFRKNIKIPGKLGIVGTNNESDICMAAWPNLDSVVLRFKEIGKAAAQWVEALELGKPPQLPRPFSPVGVNRRRSTLLQITTNSELEPMIKAFHAIPIAQLNVQTWLRHCPISRRTLERKIREESNLSLRELIDLRRLEEAEHLLANTNRTVADITQACGFSTTRSLELLFKKHHNQTPAAFGKACKTSF